MSIKPNKLNIKQNKVKKASKESLKRASQEPQTSFKRASPRHATEEGDVLEEDEALEEDDAPEEDDVLEDDVLEGDDVLEEEEAKE